MTRHRLYNYEPKDVRDKLSEVKYLAIHIHFLEQQLIEKLCAIDQKKFYVRIGCNSLRGYLIKDLKFTRTQSQRIATEVRRFQTTVNFGHMD